MELRMVRSFVAVAESLSFTKAAKTVFITQPAITMHVRELERELGVTLIDRNRRRVELTKIGTLFLAEARALLAQVERATRVVGQADRGEIGELRIAYVSSAALQVLPTLIARFRATYPNVRVALKNRHTTTQIDNLRQQQIDVGFLRLPFAQPDLTIAAVHREPFVIVLPKKHRLARKQPLSLKELAGEKFIVYGREHAPGFYDQIVSFCQKAGFIPHIFQETDEMHVTIALVAAGVGVSILPQSPVLVQSNGIVTKAMPKGTPHSETATVIRQDEQSRVVQNFIALLHSEGWHDRL
jgi:DNA-binding transcriptional LysR family regulator